ncbi:MAG: phytanoyl-CoA dioxygenase family protein [Planctomycetes bacterium]|nr:phytanoyl-CoA dioxygenase family protein [Planctomycetota bacterium]
MPAAAQDLERCPAALNAEHRARFERDGCLPFDGFLSSSETEALKSAMSAMLRNLVAEARTGKTPVVQSDWAGMKNYSGLKIERTGDKHGVLFEPSANFDLAKATHEELEGCVRKFSFPSRGSAAFKHLAEHPHLLALLGALVGPAPILNGDMALCKPPFIGSAKPWHQDSAYFDYEPYDAGVDVWIALDDATVENGCMYVLPGAHKHGPKKHVHLDDCTIAAGRLDYSSAVPIEMRAGGVLLFSVMLPHYTPPNRSSLRRRSAQLFYRAAHTRLVSKAEHAAQFVETDGTPASC